MIRSMTILTLAVVGAAGARAQDAVPAQDLASPQDMAPALAPAEVAARAAGTWVAPPERFEVGGGASATIRRTAVMTATTESLLVEAFRDPAMTQPLLTYDSGGPMTILGPWEPVPGAYAVELVNDRSLVTAHVEALEVWAAVGLGGCPITVGEAVDISSCADGPPFQVVGCTDLDLILLSEDATTLRFGAPGTDRCVERPTGASDLAFVRQ